MAEPVIPLKTAELLHVALSTVVHVLDRNSEYPVGNMEAVLAAYRAGRDKHLKNVGYTSAQIKSFTDAAIEALTTWLEERDAQNSDNQTHFDAWAREMYE